jgi:hypothetical protein
MKKIMTILMSLLSLVALPVAAFSQDNTSISVDWLVKYYNVKDALVNSNATEAANAAKELSTLIKTLPVNKTGADQVPDYKELQQKISADASNLAATKDLVKQRVAFQALSESVITLIKTQKQSVPAYIMYCPMKKAYWVSKVEQIKNPYYGSSMLTCGSITQTLK